MGYAGYTENGNQVWRFHIESLMTANHEKPLCFADGNPEPDVAQFNFYARDGSL